MMLTLTRILVTEEPTRIRHESIISSHALRIYYQYLPLCIYLAHPNYSFIAWHVDSSSVLQVFHRVVLNYTAP